MVLSKQTFSLSLTLVHLLLLLFLRLQPVKIKSVRILAPDAAQAPRTVKLFTNRPSLGFGDVEDIPATQEFTIEEDKATDALLTLRFVKFQTVNSVTIFIDDNQGGGDVTTIGRIEFFGEGRDAMDVGKIQDVAKEAKGDD